MKNFYCRWDYFLCYFLWLFFIFFVFLRFFFVFLVFLKLFLVFLRLFLFVCYYSIVYEKLIFLIKWPIQTKQVLVLDLIQVVLEFLVWRHALVILTLLPVISFSYGIMQPWISSIWSLGVRLVNITWIFLRVHEICNF